MPVNEMVDRLEKLVAAAEVAVKVTIKDAEEKLDIKAEPIIETAKKEKMVNLDQDMLAALVVLL